ncbi:MAG: complex I subunit 5 family protein [Gammaproteobacteria bacterium]
MTSTTLISLLPALVVALPLLGGVLALPLRRYGERRRLAVLGTLCCATMLGVFSLVPGALAGEVRAVALVHFAPQVQLYLRVDAMGALFAATVSVLFLLALVYSVGYLRRDGHETRYYAFFMLSLGWMLGVAFAGNLITLLVFYELFSILVYPLVVHEETPEAIRAGTKYIVYILVGGSLVLLGVIFAFFLAGDQPFTPGGMLDPDTDRTLLMVTFWCLVVGFGVKAALMPLHGWVPDVHPAAPASFSALLSGVMVATGCFGILRVVFEVFGVGLVSLLGVMPVLTGVAAVSVLLAAILAAGEDDLKRRLAWSTISQMAYVVMAISLLSPHVTSGALVHISNHAFLKGALFFCAGLLASQAGIRRVSEMAGAARRMPLTMAAFSVAALGIVGVPPLSGFISKWVLGVGMLEAGHPLVLLVLLGGALLAALYLLQPVWLAYFHAPAADAPTPQRPEAPRSMLIPLLVATLLSLLLGIAAATPGLPLSLAVRAAAVFFGAG